MWLGLKLLASGAFDGLLRGLSEVLKWIFADVRNALLAAFVPAFLWAAIVVIPDLREDLAASEKLVEATQLAHLGTITNFIDASDEAQRQAEANVIRVRLDQEAITHEVTRDLRSDLAAVTARFDRLRRAAARTDPGRADAAGLPGSGNAPGRAAGAAPDQDLRVAGDLTPQPLCPAGLVCLTIDEAEEASRDAHNHDRLIDWVFGQSAVRFSPEGSTE